ncbi:MAG: LysM peptidoglycan-binding domain-containing protein [Longimicrobiales bacterium]
MNHRTAAPARFLLSLAILSTGATTALPGPLGAQEPAQKREHVVKRGDTLWDLARAYLSNPFLWPAIYDANRAVVENPHWIYPAERLVIPPVPDAPAAATAVAVSVQQAQPEQPATAPGPTARSRFYNPPPPPREEDRATVLVGGTQAVYAVTPHEYRASAWLADSASLGVLGRIEAMEDPSRAEDRLASKLHPYDRVHVGRLQGQRPGVGDSLLVVRLGRSIAPHGRVIEPVALLHVEGGTGTMVTGTLVHVYGEGRLGDVVIPIDRMPAMPRGEARPIADGAYGRLIDVLLPQPHPGQTDIAFVDLGRSEGVGIGDELMLYVPERPLADGRAEQVPATEVATMRVVRVEDATATVRIVGMRYAAVERGLNVRVVRRVQ